MGKGLYAFLMEKLLKVFYQKIYEPSLHKRAMLVLEEMKQYERPVLQIEVSDDQPGLLESKFGGLPYIPKGGEVPKGSDSLPLCLLAQFELSDLPGDIFPLQHGILQFWVADNEMMGLDFEDPLSGKDSCVRYYPDPIEPIDEAELQKIYPGPGGRSDGWFPFEGTFGLNFTAGMDPVGVEEEAFDTVFMETWKKNWPKSPLQTWFDLPNELSDEISEQHSGFGHKLMGRPGFTQGDPRYHPGTEKMVLLFQMDSRGTEGHEIMWGDAGICNWFIALEDLEKGDFSRVLFNWDCY